MSRPLTLSCAIALLCPAAFSQTPPASSPALPAGTQPSATQPSSQPVSARDVLSDMLKPGTADRLRPLTPLPGTPLIDRTTVNPVIPGQRPITLRREGSYVVDRTGRVTRQTDGKTFEFNFESDGQTLQDPPMILTANLTLMMVQDQLKGSSRDLRFRVTGMVTEYMGRNYLMLSKAIVVTENAGLAGGT